MFSPFLRFFGKHLVLMGILTTGQVASGAAAPAEYDVVVYGGTSAGVTAAVEAHRLGKSVVLISPAPHLGGMTSGGLGFADVGDQKTVGGLCEEFFHRVWLHYREPGAWTVQKPEEYKFIGQHGPGKDDARQIMILFEPHVAEDIYKKMLAENAIPVVHARLDLKAGGVTARDRRIQTIRMEDGQEFRGKQYIDTSYEGDLMAKAGVGYIVGRESNDQYGETINGIQLKPERAPDALNISPYNVAGKPESGLLPGIRPDVGGPNGSADKRIQAFCYRMCLTDAPENRVPLAKPAGYDEKDFELLFRMIEAGEKEKFIKISPMPNRKTDCNNGGMISLDAIGLNYDYPEGDYATRERIARAHAYWQKGYLWTLQNHPRVPEAIRRKHAAWGLPKDEFIDSDHWSPELYMREGRRMVGDFVETGKQLQARHTARSIGMASYRMDSHSVQRVVGSDGWIWHEGGVNQVVGPYQIDYGAIVPKAAECENLLVPVCLSASHIAYGSIRMEPVFMILGQSAGAAACLAVDERCAVAAVPYAKLREIMLRDKQVLAHPSAPAP